MTKPSVIAAIVLLSISSQIQAHALREKGKPATVARSTMTVTPPRDWNTLSDEPGKHAETWTLDGEQLNDVTFYGGVSPGEPLRREASRKRKPLPRFRAGMLLVEVPELLESTYRASKDIASFTLTGSAPNRFLGRDGIRFTFDYVDVDNLPRKGEGRAALVDGRLYMATFEAPRLHYFEKGLADFRALADSATLD